MEMLSFDDTTFGVQECKLNLAKLYPEPGERCCWLRDCSE